MVSSPSTVGGIVQRGSDRLIPSSKRPDGSLRKEKKVRDGFVPAEDVVRYKTLSVRKAEEAAAQPPPGSSVVSPSSSSSEPMTKAQQKNMKRKLKRQQSQLEGDAMPVVDGNANGKAASTKLPATVSQAVAILLGEMLIADITDVCDTLAFEASTWDRPTKIKALLGLVKDGYRDTVDLIVQYAKMTALRETLLKFGLPRTGDRDILVERIQGVLSDLPDSEPIPEPIHPVLETSAPPTKAGKNNSILRIYSRVPKNDCRPRVGHRHSWCPWRPERPCSREPCRDANGYHTL
jgi:hypothetical protein